MPENLAGSRNHWPIYLGTTISCPTIPAVARCPQRAEVAGRTSTGASHFGEYALNADGQVVALICDDLLHVRSGERETFYANYANLRECGCCGLNRHLTLAQLTSLSAAPHPACGHVDSLSPARSALTGFRLCRTLFAVSQTAQVSPERRSNLPDRGGEGVFISVNS